MDSDFLQSQIAEQCLENIPFEGFRWPMVKETCCQLGYEEEMAEAVFPSRLQTVADSISRFFDQEMSRQLAEIKGGDMRIRDRVATAVEIRLRIMSPYKEALRDVTGFWVRGKGGLNSGRAIWRTADIIWIWAGDTATDYNRYTKRALLSGVLISTMLYWLNQTDADLSKTSAFLNRRIENVLMLGKVIGRFKKSS